MTIGPNSQYNSSQPYGIGQTVLLGSVVYEAIAAVPPNTAPPNSDFWVVVPINVEGPAGAPSLVHYTFPFDHTMLTALATGVDVLDLNIGDTLFEIWMEIDIAFNGTTPKGDVGTFSGAEGLFAEIGSAVCDLTVADTVPTDNTGLLLPTAAKSLGLTKAPLAVTAVGVLKLVVSENGQIGGTAPGSTAGKGVLHVVTVPAAENV